MTGRGSLVAVLVMVAVAMVGGTAAAAGRMPTNSTVRCSDVIETVATPTLDEARVVLGLVAVPPARIERAAPSGTTRWTHFAKWGMLIHSGTRVQVSVPRAWRSRVAITWGASTPIVSVLQFAPCRLPDRMAKPWNAYPGGFYINTATACVPLTIIVGHRSRTVRFGLGRSCSS